MTRLLAPDADGLDEAARLLRDGGLVAFPSETVYGLGGDARNDRAVARIYEAKGRPSFNPLIVHLPDAEAVARFAVLPAGWERLGHLWPGPMTLVLPVRPGSGLSPLVTAGLDSVAVRVPAHPVTRALLRAFGGPLAGPSANPSGRISPTRADHVLDGLSGRIEAVVDGGPCAVGVESTILGLVGAPRLLRPGGVPVEELEAILGPLPTGGDAAQPSAPGQLVSHYAPRGRVRLNTRAAGDEVGIGFGAGPEGLNLSPSADLVEAAANLFHMLRAADDHAGAGGTIAVAPIPETGLGRAINDRLRRAAAPR
ncbi:L-threonylcarbamoyladenylate synthase [Falsirhodobacter halotolerans]|uniref:L-threonylcarbamoyladenylate synthase n=1 Tax=Falsirhodobacter halotolerans TaxID=1146892 RepID=UPI001FD0704F|nr:L-threonylcarbamoyladenylate synthase [Falsirhodobacter halotolerans]MCJ8140503.1 L-threonylcarbamoyladenylate synthase [Falsirhodobacter halotolerans]